MSGEGKRSDWPSLKPPRPSSTLLRPLGNLLQTRAFCVQTQRFVRTVRSSRSAEFEEFPVKFPDSREFSPTRLDSRLSETGFAGLRPPPYSTGKPTRFPGRQKPSQFRSVSEACRGLRTEFRPFSRVLRPKSPASLRPQNSVSKDGVCFGFVSSDRGWAAAVLTLDAWPKSCSQ